MESKINKVYENLKKTIVETYSASEKSISAKTALDKDIAVAYAEGIVEGKNQAQRDGWIEQHYAFRIAELEQLQADERQMKHNLELARIDVEEVRALLRLKELTA